MNFLPIAKVKRLAFLFLFRRSSVLYSVQWLALLRDVVIFISTFKCWNIRIQAIPSIFLQINYSKTSFHSYSGPDLRRSNRGGRPMSPQNRNRINVYFVSSTYLHQELLLQLKECSNIILAFQLLRNQIRVYGMRASGSPSWSTSFAFSISVFA